MSAAAVDVLVMSCLAVDFESTVDVAVGAAAVGADVVDAGVDSDSDSGPDFERDGSDMDKVVVSARM